MKYRFIMVNQVRRLGVYGLIGLSSLLIGGLTSMLNMYLWTRLQYILVLTSNDGVLNEVIRFYVIHILSIASILLGIYSLFRGISSYRVLDGSIVSILGDVLRSRKYRRFGYITGISYLIIYSLLSGLLIYQPDVDFKNVYGVDRPSIYTVGCCGGFGSTPKLSIFISPEYRIGSLIIPLNLLFASIIPILFGFNMAIAYYSYEFGKGLGDRSLYLNIGAVTGLFTGCPTCAGIFLLNLAGGLGGGIASTLATYQVFFIVISIPLLISTPIYTAYQLSRRGCCKI